MKTGLIGHSEITLGGKESFIFEKFTKLDMFTEGLCLGLFLCRRVVMLMDGTLTLDRQYTNGSRFVVSLPVTHPDSLTY